MWTKAIVSTYGMPFENAPRSILISKIYDNMPHVGVLSFSLYFFILAINHRLFKVLSRIWQNISIVILVAFLKISLAGQLCS